MKFNWHGHRAKVFFFFFFFFFKIHGLSTSNPEILDEKNLNSTNKSN